LYKGFNIKRIKKFKCRVGNKYGSVVGAFMETFEHKCIHKAYHVEFEDGTMGTFKFDEVERLL